MTRQHNDGLRKFCGCKRRAWPKCRHAWHFNYKWNGIAVRNSLDRLLGRTVTSKTEAEHEAENIRIAIRAGRWGQPDETRPALDGLTLRQLLATYERDFLTREHRGLQND